MISNVQLIHGIVVHEVAKEEYKVVDGITIYPKEKDYVHMKYAILKANQGLDFEDHFLALMRAGFIYGYQNGLTVGQAIPLQSWCQTGQGNNCTCFDMIKYYTFNLQDG
jgi:hypothetical protein